LEQFLSYFFASFKRNMFSILKNLYLGSLWVT
jgi:hypothetical protein